MIIDKLLGLLIGNDWRTSLIASLGVVSVLIASELDNVGIHLDQRWQNWIYKALLSATVWLIGRFARDTKQF